MAVDEVFDAEELLRWAETYGHPEEWAKRGMAAHTRAEEAEERAERAETERDEAIKALDDALELAEGLLDDALKPTEGLAALMATIARYLDEAGLPRGEFVYRVRWQRYVDRCNTHVRARRLACELGGEAVVERAPVGPWERVESEETAG